MLAFACSPLFAFACLHLFCIRLLEFASVHSDACIRLFAFDCLQSLVSTCLLAFAKSARFRLLVCIRLLLFACLHSLICNRGEAPSRSSKGGTLASWLAGWLACLFDWCLAGHPVCVHVSLHGQLCCTLQCSAVRQVSCRAG